MMIKFTVTTKQHGCVLEQTEKESDIADIVADYASEGDEPEFRYGWPQTKAKRLPKIPAELEAEMLRLAETEYQQCAPDLPREGYGHNIAAIEHVAGRLYDTMSLQGNTDVAGHAKRIACKALRPYLSSDEPRLTRANERKEERARAREQRFVIVPRRFCVPQPRQQRAYSELAGYKLFMRNKPRKGVGSY